jgi:hypothetical protein
MKIYKVANREIKTAEKWIATDSDFNQANYPEEIGKTYDNPPSYVQVKEYDPIDPNQIDSNISEFMTKMQSYDPTRSDFAVDPREKSRSVPPTSKRRVTKILSEVGRKYWPEFPLDEIFGACIQNGIVPLQEDGTPWAGMIGSQGDCGHQQPAMQIELAVKAGEVYVPANNMLIITACTMPSGKLEIVAYIS